ncbi:phage tail tape measure protein, TP901 family, core region (plasmid) [Clostridium botulinum]|uniref:phage tail tape measure protein n=1 Tax=Clostridium botulinum TaxID=1491 RepID=UPI0008FCBD7A|nr:phage tail tape measure protein [Clostridium botulinum]APC82242.1 phage tail tape measure protein, TP901 family, core region [Clostridium botulinum]HBJ1686184.1 phage tail tape measure protein [Clostridium botulinum]
MAGLKELTYVVSFESKDSALSSVLNKEKQIDSGFEKITQSSTKAANSFSKIAQSSASVGTIVGNITKASQGMGYQFEKSNEEAKSIKERLIGVAQASLNLNQNFNGVNTQLSSASAHYAKLREESNQVKASTTSTNSELSKATSYYAKMKEETKQTSVGYTTINNELRKASSYYAKNTEKTTKIKKDVKDLADAYRDTNGKIRYANGDLVKMQELTRAARKEARGLKSETQEVEKNTKGMGGGIGKIAKIAAGAFTAKKIFDLGKAMMTTYAEFEQGMANVHATMGKISNDDYETLRSAAMKAGETTRYSSTQAAEALNYMALAGWNAKQSAGALPTVLNLAAAGAMDIQLASDLVTDSMSALGLKFEDLTMFSDQMARTSQKSNTNVQQLGEAILTVGAVAKDAGLDTLGLNTELGILADSGYKGAKGGTALRNVLLNLTSPQKNVADKLKELGVATADSNGKIRPLNSILIDLKKSMSGMTEAQQQQIKALIGGKENVAGLSILLDGAGEKYDTLSAKIKDSNGASQEMADVQNNTVSGALDMLKNKLSNAMIELVNNQNAGEGFKNALVSISEHIPQLLNDLEWFMNKFGEVAQFVVENKDIIVPAIAGIVTSIITMKIIQTVVDLYGKWKKATELMTGAQAALNVVLNLNPIGLVITLVAGLVAGLIVLYNKSETARYYMDLFFNGLKNVGIAALNVVIDKINYFISKINMLIDLINKIPSVNVPNIPELDHLAPSAGPKKPDTKGIGKGSTSVTAAGRGGKIIQKLATGTKNAIGGKTLVGENGPEILNLNRGDEVTPANTTRRLLNQGNKGSTPNININIDIHDSGNPLATGKAVAEIVREELASIFNTTSMQLSYTDIG